MHLSLLSFDEPGFQILLDIGQARDGLPGIVPMVEVFPLDEIVHLVVDHLLVQNLLDLVDPVTTPAAHLVNVLHSLFFAEMLKMWEFITLCL